MSAHATTLLSLWLLWPVNEPLRKSTSWGQQSEWQRLAPSQFETCSAFLFCVVWKQNTMCVSNVHTRRIHSERNVAIVRLFHRHRSQLARNQFILGIISKKSDKSIDVVCRSFSISPNLTPVMLAPNPPCIYFKR